jgi:hypothetical protein
MLVPRTFYADVQGTKMENIILIPIFILSLSLWPLLIMAMALFETEGGMERLERAKILLSRFFWPVYTKVDIGQLRLIALPIFTIGCCVGYIPYLSKEKATKFTSTILGVFFVVDMGLIYAHVSQ